jgi:hypothetical protein
MTNFHFSSSCIKVSIDYIKDLWIYYTVMAPTYGRMMGSASGGDWENYHKADEHTHMKNVFE